MKVTAVALSTVAVMALGVSAQANSTAAPAPGGSNSTNSTTPGATNGTNTTTPGANGTTNGTAPHPSGSSAAFAIAAGSEGIVAAGVFAGLLAALV